MNTSDYRKKLIEFNATDKYYQEMKLMKYLLDPKAGDVIFVPMRKGKMIDKKAPVIIPFATALTATLVLISFLQK